MSENDKTTQQGPEQPERETVEVTVEVPAHRVEQFRRLHEKFLAISSYWDERYGNEDLFGRGPWGRRGRHGRRCGHGHRHGYGSHSEQPADVQQPQDA